MVACQKRAQEAAAFLNSIPETSVRGRFQQIRIELAARQNQIPACCGLRCNPFTAARLELIATVANKLRVEGNFAANHLLLEYVFQQRLSRIVSLG